MSTLYPPRSASQLELPQTLAANAVENETESLHPGLGEASPVYPRRYAAEVVASGFIANFMVFGIAFTFGVFQDFYSSPSGPLNNSSHAAIAMIGTLASATTYLFAIFNNAANTYLKSPKVTMLVGSVTMSVGLIMAASAQKGQLYQFILSQGLVFGIGASLVYIPPVVCAPPFFTRHRGIALGILFSGTGIGALVISPILRIMINNVGWRWSLRILGLTNLVGTSLAALFVHQHPAYLRDPVPLKSMFNYRAVDMPSLVLQLGAGFFQSAGYLISLNYMSTYAETLGFTAQQGANFIALNNGINAAFKILLGHMADRTGRLNMIIVCTILSTTSVLVLWMITARATFISFVVIYGVFSGAIISLLPTCLSEIFGIKNYQSISGLMYFFRGCGNFLGAPVAGLLIANSNNKTHSPTDYRNAVIYNGIVLFASSIMLIALKIRVEHTLFDKQRV